MNNKKICPRCLVLLFTDNSAVIRKTREFVQNPDLLATKMSVLANGWRVTLRTTCPKLASCSRKIEVLPSVLVGCSVVPTLVSSSTTNIVSSEEQKETIYQSVGKIHFMNFSKKNMPIRAWTTRICDVFEHYVYANISNSNVYHDCLNDVALLVGCTFYSSSITEAYRRWPAGSDKMVPV